MLSIEMSDLIGVLESCAPYLIGFGVVAVLAIIAVIACRKMSKSRKFLVRSQAGMAVLLALGVVVNLICFGPCRTLISLASGEGTISDETAAEANQLVEETAGEGIVLLENEGATLPLAKNSKLNVFGWASTNPCYGGTGSGSLNDAYPTVSLYEGLQNAGFELNTELEDFYKAYRADRPTVAMRDQDWTLPEPPVSTYTDEMMTNAKNFSDTAMVVITRVGGEGADLPTDMAAVIDGSWQNNTSSHNGVYTNNSTEYNDFEQGDHFLQLSKTEQDMIDLVCENFDKVVVVYNGANAMELGFVEEHPQIKGVVWCPGTGQSGFNALGSILCGDVNPSGRTVDTFVYDLTKAPYWNNLGSFDYDNMDEFFIDADMAGTGWYPVGVSPKFVNYVEGIYVGYRFYETAAAEGLIDYDKTVQYPFGYGLSYTSFTQKMSDLQTAADGTIAFDVTVTNTGSVAGKDVVEVYYNPPYTNGGIEKSTANLVAFDKTEMLEPGASETVTISFKNEDMASFDEKVNGCYVLEDGDYTISINSDSHTALDSRVYHVDSDIVYNESNPRSTDATAATVKLDGEMGDFTVLSRADHFANYAEATAAPTNFTMPEDVKATFNNNASYDPSEYNDPNDVAPTTGADNGVKLADLRGLDYDDPTWDSLLDQMSVDDMADLIALGGYQTAAIDSIGKVSTIDCDGPASINNNFTGVGSLGFPSSVMIAATWNVDIAEKFGESIGKMADEMGVSGWYAPAVNTHRSAFGGRNFEYYSEDGLLAGKIAANAVQGAEKFGVYAYLKHFALNDQEEDRQGMLCTWSDEQATREIYLKPFEIGVKEGGADAIMAAFNYVGTSWAGACSALLQDVLRGEWGFHGMVLTDAFGRGGRGFANADQGIRNGLDLCLINYDGDANYVKDRESATSLLAMRQACKDILYVTVNSRAYDASNMQTGPMAWEIAAYAIDAVLIVLFLAIEAVPIRKSYLKRKEQEK